MHFIFSWGRFFPTEDAFYLLVGKVLRRKGLGGRARHREKRSQFFAFSKRQSHDVVIAFLYGDNKK
ncbi:hypothetical protein COK10_19360 [Bacillus anthracis]|nr:hypothetical protein COK10_19360 [Bacillus anthracis]